MRKFVSVAVLTAMVFTLVACGGKKENTVHSIDDLPGKTIGVQLGTTGDIYASDYEAEGSTIERLTREMMLYQPLRQESLTALLSMSSQLRLSLRRIVIL